MRLRAKTYEEVIVEVENVLVAPVSSSSLPDTINPDGKKAVYTLAVPKGDQHDWKDKKWSFSVGSGKRQDFPMKESMI